MARKLLSGKGILASWLLFSFLLFPGRLSHAQFSRQTTLDNVAPGSIELVSTEEALGSSCVRVGDVDNDGLDDILVTLAPLNDFAEGLRALLIYGQKIPPGKVDPLNAPIRKSILEFPSGEMEVAGGADVNGDGIDDFVVDLSPYSAVIFGSRALPARIDLSQVGTSVAGVKILRAPGIELDRVSLSEDINGDGIGEILVGDTFFGANTEDWGKGRVYVIFGSNHFPKEISLEDVGTTVPGFIVKGSRPNDHLGQGGDGIGLCAEGIRDIDGDGFGDLGIAGNSCFRGSYVIFGRKTFPPVIEVDDIPGNFGIYLREMSGCMKAMGDFNGDGFNDFTFEFGGEPLNPDLTDPLHERFDFFIVGGRPRAEFPIEVTPSFILEDARTTIIQGGGALCPAALPFDGGIDVDRNGTADVVFSGIDPGPLALPSSYQEDNGTVYILPTRKDLPRVITIKDIVTSFGFLLTGRPKDRLGDLSSRLSLLRDFDGEGEGEILVGAGQNLKGISRTYIIPIREFLNPGRLKLTGASPDVGSTDGGDLTLLSGEGFFPGTELFFGGVQAKVFLGTSEASAWVWVPPWPGGPMAVDIVARRGELSSVLKEGFRYFKGPVVDVRDIEAGNVRGSELFTKLRYFNANDGNFANQFLDPRIEKIEIVQDLNGDKVDDILLRWDAGQDPDDPRRQFAPEKLTTSVIYGGSHLNSPFDYVSMPSDKGIVMPYSRVLEATEELDEPDIGDLFGSGDVNGDGFGDLVCGTFSKAGDTGSIYILYGGKQLPTQTHPQNFPSRTRIYGKLFTEFRIVEDLDGGGMADLIVGFYDDPSVTVYDDGIVFIRGEDLNRFPDDVSWLDLPTLVIKSRLPEIREVRSLDWNGDGKPDLALSSAEGSFEGVLILYGGTSFWQTPGPASFLLSDSFLKRQGENRGDLIAGRRFRTSTFWGHSLSNAGDLDGDGADDLLVGNAFATGEVEGQTVSEGGEAYLLGVGALQNELLYPDLAGAWAAVFGVTPTAFYDPGQPQKGVFTVQGAFAHEFVGKVVEGVGDLNGDGAPDLALGSWFLLPNDSRDPLPPNSGMPYTYILFGKKSLLEGENAVLRRENFTEGLMIRGAGNVIAGGRDVNGDGVPDLIIAREQSRAYILFGGQDLGSFQFRRGDVNLDGRVDISDAIHLLSYLFLGGERPRCLDSADVDDGGAVDISDAISILQFLFQSGNPPKPPFPEAGKDPTPDGLDCRS